MFRFKGVIHMQEFQVSCLLEFSLISFYEERLEKEDLWEEILQTSKLVKELPASLVYSG